jgi:hypothetical protein
MPQRNGPRSSRGRSAVARKVQFSGPGKTDGMFPQTAVRDNAGNIIGGGYFGGNKKGGAAPSATGFMIPSGRRNLIATPATNRNFLFTFKTNPGRKPSGHGPYA